jgi:hypothetical protein
MLEAQAGATLLPCGDVAAGAFAASGVLHGHGFSSKMITPHGGDRICAPIDSCGEVGIATLSPAAF